MCAFKSFFIICFLFVASSPSSALGQKKEPKKSKEEIKEEKQMRKSQRAMWVAHVLREKKEERQIKDLKIDNLKVPVFLIPKAESFRPLVKLKLEYNKEGWSLFDSTGAKIRRAEAGDEHSLYAYLNSRVSTVNITAKGPNEEESKETIYIFAPEAREFKTVRVFNSMQFYVGHSYLVYRQGSVGRFVSQSLLLGAKYISPEKGGKIGYLADVSSTVYTYDSSPIKRTSNFLEGRAALTYKKKLFKNPQLRSRFFAGVSTINLFSLGSQFGFNGLFGPNLGLRTEYYKSGVNSYSAELQYVPYEYEDPISERTLKLSLEWTKNLNNTRRAQLGFSYANHEFTSGADSFSADLVSLYFSMSF